MSDYRYYASPRLDMTGVVPDDAERLTREEMQEHLDDTLKDVYNNDSTEQSYCYRVVTNEEIQGTGPVCWSGQNEYLFDFLSVVLQLLP